MAPRGVILLAHGARDPRWSEAFEVLRERLAALAPEGPLSPAFLPFMPPDLAGAARQLVAHGCRAIAAVPAFPGVGGHVRRDVPALTAAIEHEHPGGSIRLLRAPAQDALAQDATARAALAALR
jgi:sirohydrochlorin cobaltochelatase